MPSSRALTDGEARLGADDAREVAGRSGGGRARQQGRSGRIGKRSTMMEDILTDFSIDELREFLEADLVDVKVDPEFKERLRKQLWDLVQEQRARPAARRPALDAARRPDRATPAAAARRIRERPQRQPAHVVAERIEREARVRHRAVRHGPVDQPGVDRGLAQRERRDRLARHQRPGVEERREIDHVVVERIGDARTRGRRARGTTRPCARSGRPAPPSCRSAAARRSPRAPRAGAAPPPSPRRGSR